MAETQEGPSNRLRMAAWAGAAVLFLLPLAAMQLTSEVAWGPLDLAVFGVLLLGSLSAYEVTVRLTADGAYRLAVGIALAAAGLLVWLSLGVGIIGRDGDPANLMYFGVLAVGIGGILIARFRARGMAGALLAMALAQSSAAVIALIAPLGRPWSGPLELIVLNGFFVALFAGSAWLFLRAANSHPDRGSGITS